MTKQLYAMIGLLLLLNVTAFGQTAFYDAKFLKEQIATRPSLSGKLLLTPRPDQVIALNLVLKNYLPDSIVSRATTDSALFIEIRHYFSSNAFIEIGRTQEEASLLTSLSGSATSTGFFGSIGSLNVSALADGLAKFLVERAKEEMTVAFFDKLKDLSRKYPEFETLFPNTRTLLINFESWEYSNIIMTLREAFDKDLKSLLYNITQLANLTTASCDPTLSGSQLKKCQERISTLNKFLGRPEGRVFLSATVLGDGFVTGQKLPDIINKMTGPNFLGAGLSTDVTTGVQLINVLSLSLRNQDATKDYITADDLHELFADSVSTKIFLALVHQQIKKAGIHSRIIDNVAINQAAFLNGIKNYTDALLIKVNAITIAYDSLAAAKKRQAEDLTVYFAGIFESGKLFLMAAKNVQLIDPSIVPAVKLDEVFLAASKTLQISHDIAIRNYSAAVIGVVTLLSEKLPANDFTKQFVKYGSFAANVVQSKNSDDIKAAIKAVALPAGSASIKKNSSFNVSLNGYLGGFYGREFLRESPGRKWAPITGVYAPVGVAASWGLPKGWSASIFLPMIDISAFASFRLQDDTTKALPEVSLKNILAPGLGLVIGLPKVPLSVGYTWQYGPMLREIKNTDISASDKPNHRWQFFLAVDIPIVNFYTKTK